MTTGPPVSSPAVAFVKAIGLMVASLAGVLATVSGCVAAVDWASATLGSLAIVGIFSFLGGCVVTHAVHQAVGAARARRSP